MPSPWTRSYVIQKLCKHLRYHDDTNDNVRNTHHPGPDAVCQYVNLNKVITQTRFALLIDWTTERKFSIYKGINKEFLKKEKAEQYKINAVWPQLELSITIGLQAVAESWRVIYHGCPNSIHCLIRFRSKSNLVPHRMFFVGLRDVLHQLCPAVCLFLKRVPMGTFLQKAS